MAPLIMTHRPYTCPPEECAFKVGDVSTWRFNRPRKSWSSLRARRLPDLSNVRARRMHYRFCRKEDRIRNLK